MSPLSEKRILVVDDAPANIDILIKALGDTYLISVATEGIQALEEINREKPDLVILDILMPQMDGYEVCRRIRRDPSLKDILILFVTSLTDECDETLGFELGAVDYITKPFSPAVVRARVKTHLELAQAREELKRQNDVLCENLRLRAQVEQITRHDLKNPLQVILATAQLMTLHPVMDFEKRKAMADKQIKICYTMLNMLNQSLNLYKLENGSYPLKIEETDILPILDQILLGNNELMQSMALDVQIIINDHPRCEGDKFMILCDQMLFYTMMSNLVTNALEASPRQEPVIVRLNSHKEPLIVIENRGSVFESIQDRFFEKFVTEGKKNGTGIGTYSAMLTVRAHRGFINLVTSDDQDLTQVEIQWPKSLQIKSHAKRPAKEKNLLLPLS